MKKYTKYLATIFLPITAIVLIALQIKPLGFILLLIGSLLLLICSKKFRKDIVLIYISLAILGITPINTGIQPFHMLLMGLLLSAAIAIPYVISRFITKEYHVKFPFRFHRKWTRLEVVYILLAILLPYFVFPYALRETGSYLNWTVTPGILNLTILFIGTNMLGIWDELFFVNTVLGILRNHFSFPIANTIQAILFTSFLYDLGFRGWFFIIIFCFALLQGYMYKKTDSLFYIIIIHLSADLILYFALIQLHHPDWLAIFIT